MSDFFSSVPTDLEGNLAYRVRVRERAARDEGFRRAVETASKHDFLWWLSTFAFLYEPRPRFDSAGRLLPKRIPFIPWEHQIPVLKELRENLGFKDIGVIKSRGEGISWSVVYLALHDFLFDDRAKIGMVSRSEEEADDQENADSLLWKVQFGLDTMPPWMAGVKNQDYTRNVGKHSFTNKRNGSQINADAATGAVFRGGRCKWALFDEFAFFKPGEDSHALASSQGATDSRLFVSTVNGTDNEFYRVMQEKSSMVYIDVDWRQNPSKNKGLYRIVGGKPVAVDAEKNSLPSNHPGPDGAVLDYVKFNDEVQNRFRRLRDRGYRLEDKIRSPWYDDECFRAGADPNKIARELDKDWGGSMARYFTPDFFIAATKTVKKPILVGRLGYNPETLEADFEVDPGGNCNVWVPLDVKNRPPESEYLIGADASSGSGGEYTSNSTAFVLDALTMEQVFDFASHTTEPADFGDLLIALAKWFWDAELGWEHAGPGTAVTKHIIRRGYPRVYKREIQHKQTKKRTQDVGWHPSAKEPSFADFSREVRQEKIVLRSKELVTECTQYIRDPMDKIAHVMTRRAGGGSHGGLAHGDRVIAAVVALQVARKRGTFKEGRTKEQRLSDNPPKNTLAARMRSLQEAGSKSRDDWDDRTNWDLAHGDRSNADERTSAW